jgi:hypothetical protein
MTSIIRKILRRAESAFSTDDAKRQLAEEGIVVGEARKIDREHLLAELAGEDEDESPSVLLTVYTGDAPAGDRGWFEDPVADFVESEGFGTWLGGGQGSFGDRHFFDVSFSVNDIPTAVERIKSFLASRFPNVEVEITSSSDRA